MTVKVLRGSRRSDKADISLCVAGKGPMQIVKALKADKVLTPKEQQLIFRDTHAAIVDEAVWERVQELRENRRRPTKAKRQGFFSGLVFCSDCGSKLHLSTRKGVTPEQDCYR